MAEKERLETIKSIAGMAGVVILVLAGLATGHDGVVLGSGLGVLAGVSGFYAGKKEKPV